MSKSMKNITSSLIAATLIFGGYYYYSQKNIDLAEGGDSLIGDMLLNTQVFIERRAVLEKTEINTELFSNPVFKTYKSFSKPVPKEPLGRENPFGRVTSSNTP